MEWLQILVSTLAGFVFAILLEPIRDQIALRLKLSEIRHELYRELAFALEMIRLVKVFMEQDVLNAGSAKAYFGRLRKLMPFSRYDYYSTQERGMFMRVRDVHSVAEAKTGIDGLLETGDLALLEDINEELRAYSKIGEFDEKLLQAHREKQKLRIAAVFSCMLEAQKQRAMAAAK